MTKSSGRSLQAKNTSIKPFHSTPRAAQLRLFSTSPPSHSSPDEGLVVTQATPPCQRLKTGLFYRITEQKPARLEQRPTTRETTLTRTSNHTLPKTNIFYTNDNDSPKPSPQRTTSSLALPDSSDAVLLTVRIATLRKSSALPSQKGQTEQSTSPRGLPRNPCSPFKTPQSSSALVIKFSRELSSAKSQNANFHPDSHAHLIYSNKQVSGLPTPSPVTQSGSPTVTETLCPATERKTVAQSTSTVPTSSQIMANHEIILAEIALLEEGYEMEPHGEEYSAAVEEVTRTRGLKDDKTAEINDLKRKADQEAMRVVAKKAKLDDLNDQLLQAKIEVFDSDLLASAANAAKDKAEAELKELSQAEVDKQESVKAIQLKAQDYDRNIEAARNKINVVTFQATEKLSTWSDGHLQQTSAALFYPTPKGLFLEDKGDSHKDDESEAGSVSELSPRKGDDAVKEASGMIQRINNPMYLIDRVVDFVTSKFAEAQLGQAPSPGTPVPLDGSGISGGKLCFLIEDGKFNKLVDAPTHILLAVVLSGRLDEKADEMVKNATGATITELSARGKVALEFIEEYKAELTTQLETDDTKLKKKILATASTGRLFKEIVDYYGHGILIVLPLTEFFNFTRKQRADSIPKGKLQTLIDIINNQVNDLMLKTLKLLVTLLNGWMDYSSFKFSLAANKVNAKQQFMAEIKELREQLDLPVTPAIAFSHQIDIKPVDRWELLASTSGWDIARKTALSVFSSGAGPAGQLINPCAVLGEILGQRYSYRKNNFIVEYNTDMEMDTMIFLCRLLFKARQSEAKPPGHKFHATILDCRDKFHFDARAYAMDGYSTQLCVVMRLEESWVLAWLLKGGGDEYSEALVFHHGDGTCPSEEVAEAVSGLQLAENVRPVYVKVHRPQENTSGIHVLCHIMALNRFGHHWVNELSDNNIMDIRHALLRATSMAFIRAAVDETGSQGVELCL